MPASMVLTAMELMRRLPLAEAPSVEPGLNPNQPNARMKQPGSTITMSWPGIAFGLPSRVNFPMRGPMMMAIASAVMPPTACTTPEPAKSAVAVAEAVARAEARQPAAAPCPVGIERIREGAHERTTR